MPRLIIHHLRLCLVILLLAGCSSSSHEMPFALLSIGEKRAIELRTVRQDTLDVKINAFIYYVSDNQGESRLGPFTFGALDGPTNQLEFGFILSPDKDIVGVVEKANPSSILVLYKFSTGFNWPGGGSQAADWGVYWNEAKALVDELKNAYPTNDIVLGKSSTYFRNK